MKVEQRMPWRLLARVGGWCFIYIAGAATIGNMIDRLCGTGVLLGIVGATIGLAIALFYIYFNFGHINR